MIAGTKIFSALKYSGLVHRLLFLSRHYAFFTTQYVRHLATNIDLWGNTHMALMQLYVSSFFPQYEKERLVDYYIVKKVYKIFLNFLRYLPFLVYFFVCACNRSLSLSFFVVKLSFIFLNLFLYIYIFV